MNICRVDNTKFRSSLRMLEKNNVIDWIEFENYSIDPWTIYNFLIKSLKINKNSETQIKNNLKI